MAECKRWWSRRVCMKLSFFFFFFSSRRRHTRFKCDWSSDVCSSDLLVYLVEQDHQADKIHQASLGGHGGCSSIGGTVVRPSLLYHRQDGARSPSDRSEERRVGKEGRSRWSPYH